MNKNGFEFYHIVKNEDAHPFSHLWEKGDGFIVAADGLGGSGSTVHRLSDEQHARLAETLPGLILPEYYYENVTFMTAACHEEAIRDVTPDGDVDANQIADLIVDTIKETLPEEGAEEIVDENAGKTDDEILDCSIAVAEESNEEPVKAPAARPIIKRDTPFDAWLDKQFASMIDDTPDTSALWGSRIAISRFVFYMLANPHTDLSSEVEREKIIAFIYKGMQAVADHYGLNAGNISGQSVLPTTFVTMKFKAETDGRILVETVWAGDSRAYALIPGQGMKQLSVDDEDESGAICNLFTLGRSNTPFATKLHYVSYRLPAKSAIFVCSDGVFDPYAPIDNIGVEAMFLEALQKANNFESLGDAWHELYSPMRHDDTSVAFRAFGFDQFKEFKENFLPAYDDVLKAYEGYHNGKKIYPIITGEEEHPQVYIEERAAKRMEQIARALAINVLDPHTPKDVTVTEHLLMAYEKFKKNQLCAAARDFLDDDPAKAADMFLYPADGSKDETSCAIRKLLDCAKDVSKAIAMPQTVKEDLEKICREGDALAARIESRIRDVEHLMLKCIEGNRIMEDLDDLLLDFCKTEMYKEKMQDKIDRVGDFFSARITECQGIKESMNILLERWKRKDFKYPPRDPSAAPGVSGMKLFPSDRHFYDELKEQINKYMDLQKQMDGIDSEYEQKMVEKYVDEVNGLTDQAITEALTQPELYLTHFAQSLFDDDVDVSVEELTEMYVYLFKENPVFFEEVITALSTAAEATILDSVFNPGRLKLARSFNSFDTDAVLKNRETVEAMLAAYEDVTAWIAG